MYVLCSTWYMYVVYGLGPNFVKNEKERICHFNNFSDTYTCTYTAYIV